MLEVLTHTEVIPEPPTKCMVPFLRHSQHMFIRMQMLYMLEEQLIMEKLKTLEDLKVGSIAYLTSFNSSVAETR